MAGRGDILRVDLTSGRVTTEPLPEEIRKHYLGGEGINSYLLWQHFTGVDPNIDGLDPDNVLILGLGPLGGTGWGGGSKMKWTFKSPIYGLFGDSVSGGFLGPNLRWAGFDHVVITGRAEKPVYLWIDDGRVEIRDASHLWGKDSEETAHTLRRDIGTGVETACIGVGGERMVRYACIMVSEHRAAGRAGGGAVMGSKNLKAIAARGTRGIEVHDPPGFLRAIDALIEAQGRIPARQRAGWKSFGTLLITGNYQRIGVNGYRNNQSTAFPDDSYQKLNPTWYREHMAAAPFSCSPGCLWACAGSYRTRGDLPEHQDYKPEYAAIAGFGIMSDIPDLIEVSRLNGLCRRHGLDVIEVGSCSAYLMELWQRGIVTDEDLAEWSGEPLSFEWGSAQAVALLIESIAAQSNTLGEIFRDGVYRAGQRIGEMKGCDALRYALYGKGGATFIEEVRHTHSWALNMAVASRGACHLKGFGTLDKMNRPDVSQHYFGTPDGAAPLSPELKGASSAAAEDRAALVNSLGLCCFLQFFDPLTYPESLFAQAIESLTGERYTAQELVDVGKRVVNLEKAFNSRLGLRREDDTLCHRWLQEEVGEGPGKGFSAHHYLEQLKDEYYAWHGWDPATGLQTRSGLEGLGMGEVAAVLEGEGWTSG
ncbi:MAG: aldehyde ferredoxin oxidoreductase C-terminal domain-containing protein [Dehalococcoidia bacterium]|nr:aldehyde ferredoxin oxidoreductase C-terminal domain-containing protein [Dehalococcoidia bacterium]